MREHVDGDFPFANDFNAIAQALADDAAVVSGCSVDDGGTDDMTVNVSPGDIRVNGTTYSVGSGSTTLSAADGSYDRYDLVVVGSDGTVDNVTGTASSQPAAPSIPADHVLLAIVFVQAGTSGVTNGDIFGARAVSTFAKQLGEHAGVADAHHTKTPLVASDSDDGSDVSTYRLDFASSGVTLLSVSGSGILLGGTALCDGTPNSDQPEVELNVDGSTWRVYGGGMHNGGSYENNRVCAIPPVVFDSSLSVVVYARGTASSHPIGASAVVKQ